MKERDDRRRRRSASRSTRPTPSPSTAPSTPTATSSSRPTCGRPTSTRSTATGPCASCSTRTGLEELEIGGQRSMMSRRGLPVDARRDGRPRPAGDAEGPARARTSREAPFGSDGPERAARAARRRGHRRRDPLHDRRAAVGGRARGPRAVARPTPRPTTAGSASSAPDEPRLVPTAHLSLSRPGRRGRRARAGRRRGRQGRLRRPVHPRRPSRSATPTTTRCSPPPRTSTCRSPSTRRSSRSGPRARAWARGRTSSSSGCWRRCTASDGVRHQFTTLFDYGVFDQFPQLKVLVLESGGGWIGYWLDRIDAVYGHTFIGDRVPLEHKPSDYFRERVLDQLRPRRADDPGAGRALRRRPVPVGVGLPARRPHARVRRRPERARRGSFPEADRAKFVGDNARALFRLD